MNKNDLDRYITHIPDREEPDYTEDLKSKYDTIEAIEDELGLQTEDFRDVLRAQGYSDGEIMSTEWGGYFNTNEFYDQLFDHFQEELEEIYKRGL